MLWERPMVAIQKRVGSMAASYNCLGNTSHSTR